jgi:8-oxo-dGTP pyrophosphatase MutT (NUDIX family)
LERRGQGDSWGQGPVEVSLKSTGTISPLRAVIWRTIFRVGFPLAGIWWRVTRMPYVGALVAVYVGSDLLMLRSSYRSAWNFPGGQVRRGETLEQAVRRELAEETGILATELLWKGNIKGVWSGRHETVGLFETYLESLPAIMIDNLEIVEARLISQGELSNISVTGPVASYFDQYYRPKNLKAM